MALFTGSFNSRLKSYFINKLGSFDYKHGWMKSDCPFCGKGLKYGVNISRNRTNCFVCGYNRPPVEAIKELEGLNTYPEVLKLLDSGNFDTHEFREEKVELREYKEGFHLPEGFRLLTQGKSQLAKSARSYVKSRGFNVKEMSAKGWGYCSGNEVMFGYLIMPFYNHGKLVYYNARNFLSNGPKYNNPNIDDTGVGKSSIWYNQDAMFMYKQIYITEGLINAETMGNRAMASGGKFVSAYQINDLIKSPVERVVIILDPDAVDRAVSLALSIIGHKKVKVIVLPEGEDPNSYGKSKTLKQVYGSRYLSYSEVIKIKNTWKHQAMK